MRFGVLMLSLLGTAGTVLGQTAATPRDTNDRRAGAPVERRAQPTTSSPPLQQQSQDAAAVAPRPDAASLLRQNRNSLLKASLSARADAGQAQLQDVSYYAVPVPEPKVIRKHDLVTIIIREESKFSSEGNAELTREANLEAVIEEFVQLKLDNWEIEGGAIGPTPPSIKMNGTREFTGEGTVDRTDRFTARITAEVLDVKPNGTLVLQARKRIRTDEEEQIFTFSGVCRAEDISADNTILSTAIHDQELSKSHKGTVREATRRGWGGKLLDLVSPF
jgi:flagellar L-ring protein precursor FlgH